MQAHSCILQLVEKLDGIVDPNGHFLTHDLSSELDCYTTLQSTDFKVACKVRLSPTFDLEQVVEHPQCSPSSANQDHPVQQIGGDQFASHAICPAQSGKFTIARYFYDTDLDNQDSRSRMMPFFLRESHTVEGTICKIMMRFEIDRKLC